ncbi:hypothetical protein SERLA73DRAFT_58493 [Serpula lacrymans var. lacrymans S7.3]|uniref:Mitochondrial carrier protein n=2 Tax=Serpula lacrymans var. lacrymans TaxID=341189 RepID=F8Q465_SERL3|nr:uncharacterized protein SERLADRAFT_371963 [Serpula lacrymans var. lacrymans S7.9]EGN96921.1 hypothetical protein SERLA73DRAFT_58493 [Serpula lacrymans var. lacrymans S7.3]EGO22518.1 hypothetical protein SERLADRAFT_371963 [Serpula lacrymans var. lacrymans S7.9]
MSTTAEDAATQERQGNSVYAALARTATRGMALYFSRPVRLFRPSKVSGWHSLRGLATLHGASLTPHYMVSLVKKQGFMVIPKHFIPPMLVNAALGTVLWTTYTETSTFLDLHLGPHPTTLAALSGAMAGGMQALAAAPAENVRLIIEGTAGRSWSCAWKEVFRGTEPPQSMGNQETIREMRQVRDWIKEVRDTAGRGWDGWGWGCAKDVCGFAAFFAIFEITRRVAIHMKSATYRVTPLITSEGEQEKRLRRYLPRTVHGVTLVTGGAIAGLAYEVLSRPWDAARKTVQLDRILHSPNERSPSVAILKKFRDEGLIYFFRNPTTPHATTSNGSRRIYTFLRTIARVGPWGVGFLVWEALGPGIQ